MAEWVIFRLPTALVLYGAALFFCLFDRFYKATKGVFTYISAALSILATAWLLLNGGSLWESSALLMIFLLLNMGVKG